MIGSGASTLAGKGPPTSVSVMKDILLTRVLLLYICNIKYAPTATATATTTAVFTCREKREGSIADKGTMLHFSSEGNDDCVHTYK